MRVALLSCAVITGLVYNVLLRDIPGDGSYEPPRRCNEVMHVWVPIPSLLVYVVGIAAFIVAVAWAAIGIARLESRRHRAAS